MEGKRLNRLKNYFLSHQVLTTYIAIFFVLCGLYGLFISIRKTCYIYNHFEKKTGVVDSWFRTDGAYNTAYLKIEGDSNVYITKRVGGWLCLQYNAKRGETVVFYAVLDKKGYNTQLHPYFGLSEVNQERTSFWLFMDILLYSMVSALWMLLFALLGLACFNGQLVKIPFLRNASIGLLLFIILLFGIASTS